jgi:hypothetical protein
MSNSVLSKSENFKSEYSCAVVQVGELTPVEGSDFLAKTDIMGVQIVVRKDQVKEGDIVLYAANETQLNEEFLSKNNLYEIGCRDKNSNAAEVNAIMEPYLKTKPEIDELRKQAKNVKNNIDYYTKSSNVYNKEIKKLEKRLSNSLSDNEKESIKEDIKSKQNDADKAYKEALARTTEYTNLKQKIADMVALGEPYVTEAKKHVGFFNDKSRVRCIVLKGEPSFGFLFSAKELKQFDNSIKEEEIINSLGEEFDTVNGKLFCKAYVPPIKKARNSGSGNRKENKLKRFDRLVEGEFAFHYDTAILAKNINRIQPDTKVSLSVKLHGTSAIIGKLKVKTPIKLPIYQRAFNWFVDKTGLLKEHRITDFSVDYGPIYSSRTVIKNQYINKDVKGGYYRSDVWTEFGDMLYPYLSNGTTVYGEICGYETGTDRYIQKMYDYKCKQGENFIMIYRITTVTANGEKFEWNIQEIKDWTEHLIGVMKANGDDNYKRVRPIDVLYHGTLENLYPEIDTAAHWHEEVLKKLERDKETLGMEENEPLCLNKVPREGFVLRIDNDPIKEAFKLKTVSFKLKEALNYDDDNFVDIEVQQGDY